MEEFLKNLTSQQWFITFVSFMTANVGVLLLGVIKMIKLKIDNNKLLEKFKDIEKITINNIDEKYEEKFQQLQVKLVSSIDKVDKSITERLKLEKQENLAIVEQAEKDFQASIDSIVEGIKLDDKEGE